MSETVENIAEPDGDGEIPLVIIMLVTLVATVMVAVAVDSLRLFWESIAMPKSTTR